MPSLNEIQEQIQVVARARQAHEESSQKRAEAQKKFELDNATLFDVEDMHRLTVDQEEKRLREPTIAYYNETKIKKPCPEVGIRESEKLEYDPVEAFAYAKEHGVALKLDVSAFEKMAKIPELRPGCVTVTPVITATIASEILVKEG